MPNEYKKYFRYGGKNRRIRLRDSGVYEVRACIHGVHISASSKKRNVAVQKFIEKLRALAGEVAPQKITAKLFKDFAAQWLEIKRPGVKESSYANIEMQFRVHLNPAFGTRNIGDLRPMELRSFLNRYIENGHNRTALKLYVTLNEFLKCALDEEIISKNPMKAVPRPRYEAPTKHILTKKEEQDLLQKLFAENHPLRYAVIFLLYTGMRRTELKSATTDGTWITVVSAKSRKGVVRTRRVPISPMLRPYMEYFTEENLQFTDDRLSRVVPKYLPEHNLHELRHTFITRAQECGVPMAVVKVWVGHAADKNNMTEAVYTHFSDEFQLSEIEKVKY